MAKILEASPVCVPHGGGSPGVRIFRRRRAGVYYDMPFPDFSPGNYGWNHVLRASFSPPPEADEPRVTLRQPGWCPSLLPCQ